MPTIRPGREPSSCSVWDRVLRPRAPSCCDGGTPRPEGPTLTPLSVQLVECGDSEDGESMPAARPRVWPSAHSGRTPLGAPEDEDHPPGGGGVKRGRVVEVAVARHQV